MKTKILILKLGYSETLDPEIGRVPSLGDVLRTTPILGALKEKFPDSYITWLVSEGAEPLLDKNQFIDRILVWDEFVPFQLMREKFDVLINLEKIPGVCALSDMIDAWVKYGFRFDSLEGKYHAYEKGLDFISYIEEKKRTNRSKGYWQQVLIEMLGVDWKGQEYILGYRPKEGEVFDIGFNYLVGSKWPNKAMSMEKWKELEQRLISMGYTVSWQEGQNDLFVYLNWINSCRTVISNDSLGLHIALALKKKVIALFGPTDAGEVYMYDRGIVINSLVVCSHMPCYNPKCITGLNCMQGINLDAIIEIIRDRYGKNTVLHLRND